MKPIMGTGLEPMGLFDLPDMGWGPEDYGRYMEALKADGLDLVVLGLALDSHVGYLRNPAAGWDA